MEDRVVFLLSIHKILFYKNIPYRGKNKFSYDSEMYFLVLNILSFQIRFFQVSHHGNSSLYSIYIRHPILIMFLVIFKTFFQSL